MNFAVNPDVINSSTLELEQQLSLRAIAPPDEVFLHQVYASTREAELALVDWSEADKQAFVTMQFNAQHQYYQQAYRDKAFQIILLNDVAVGRLYLAYEPTEIRIVDIVLLPPYRNQGIGSHLLNAVLAEGQSRGVPVRIHVERYNPAQRLYFRLGFQLLEDKGVYLLLEKLPTGASKETNLTRLTAGEGQTTELEDRF